MPHDFSDPANPLIYRPKPKKDYSHCKPTKRQAKARETRRELEDLMELRRIEKEHSL
ncbi:hypothetical protein VCSRO110_0690 [Vibrio cholerae]|nr:hypothetical protein DN36_175 [Vibrio cholerae]GHX75505.1 hypothetical protein VCSRO110_0690 [Vibrio cholerae]GHZ87260.1 hypothetical protein VCSRO35_0177 [Vibrio cholerae]GIB55276.1 hypothetical protein VCSRO188_0032 [Vibrio cholerae]